MAKRRRPSWVPMTLLSLGVLLLFLWGYHKFLYNRSLSLSDALLAQYATQPGEYAIPTHITIGTIIDLPIIEAGKINGVWTISPTRANHVRASASPGMLDNIVIYGHNTEHIFGKLNQVKPKDPVRIRTSDGSTHTYVVGSITEVDPWQTELLKPTTKEVLTIYTCSGWFDSKRLVVRASPT